MRLGNTVPCNFFCYVDVNPWYWKVWKPSYIRKVPTKFGISKCAILSIVGWVNIISRVYCWFRPSVLVGLNVILTGSTSKKSSMLTMICWSGSKNQEMPQFKTCSSVFSIFYGIFWASCTSKGVLLPANPPLSWGPGWSLGGATRTGRHRHGDTGPSLAGHHGDRRWDVLLEQKWIEMGGCQAKIIIFCFNDF